MEATYPYALSWFIMALESWCSITMKIFDHCGALDQWEQSLDISPGIQCWERRVLLFLPHWRPHPQRWESPEEDRSQRYCASSRSHLIPHYQLAAALMGYREPTGIRKVLNLIDKSMAMRTSSHFKTHSVSLVSWLQSTYQSLISACSTELYRPCHYSYFDWF